MTTNGRRIADLTPQESMERSAETRRRYRATRAENERRANAEHWTKKLAEFNDIQAAKDASAAQD